MIRAFFADFRITEDARWPRADKPLGFVSNSGRSLIGHPISSQRKMSAGLFLMQALFLFSKLGTHAKTVSPQSTQPSHTLA